jgi:hypothetical protein
MKQLHLNLHALKRPLRAQGEAAWVRVLELVWVFRVFVGYGCRFACGEEQMWNAWWLAASAAYAAMRTVNASDTFDKV